MQLAPRWLGYAALAVVFYLVVHYAVEIVVSLTLGEAAYAAAWDAALFGFMCFEVGAAIAMAWGVVRSGRRSGRVSRSPMSAPTNDGRSSDQASTPRWTCGSCGHSLRDGAHYCERCGAEVGPTAGASGSDVARVA